MSAGRAQTASSGGVHQAVSAGSAATPATYSMHRGTAFRSRRTYAELCLPLGFDAPSFFGRGAAERGGASRIEARTRLEKEQDR